MTNLQMRLMWPKRGEDVAVYRDGQLIVEGHVTFVDEHTVSIMGERSVIVRLPANELLQGIQERRIVVKKQKSLQ